MTMEMKYEFTGETMTAPGGATLRRIRAVRDFGDVKAGDLGGWIEKESNLAHEGRAWVSGDARVSGLAQVCGNAQVSGDAWVCGDACVSGDAQVCGDACVSGSAQVFGDARIERKEDYMVFKNFWSSGRYFTYTHSNGMWKVGCFYGTGEELIRKAYADSEESGWQYEQVVRYVEAVERRRRERAAAEAMKKMNE